MDRSTIYTELAEAHKLVAQVYGVVYPLAPARSRAVRWLAAADLRVDGRRVTNADAGTAIARLAEAGIIRPGEKGSGPQAAPDWVTRLTIEAHLANRLDRIQAARARENLGSISYWDKQDLERSITLRCLVVSGRLDKIGQLGEIPASAWTFLVAPEAESLVRALPDKYVEEAFLACLAEIVWTAAPADAFLLLCAERASGLTSIAAEVALIRVLQGRFDAAVEVFDAVPGALRDSKFAQVSRAATLAFIATLRGDDEAALMHIQTALAAEKSGTRKRSVFPTPLAFTLSLLALVRLGTPAAAALLGELRRTAAKKHFHPVPMWCVDTALSAQTQSAGNALFLQVGIPSLPALLSGLAGCWSGEFLFTRFPVQEQLLVDYVRRAWANGFAWVVAEGMTVLERAGSAAVAEDFGGSGAELHRALGTVSLAEVVQPLQDWEYPLKALEQLAYSAAKKPARKHAARAEKQRRLVWELVDDDYDGFEITPREQRANKNGTWSRGRVVALKRLHKDAARMEFLLDQDRAAAAAIKRDRYGYGWGRERAEYYMDARGLYALAGHPCVMNAQGQAVEIVCREPELVIDEVADGQLRARIEPYGEDGNNYLAMLVTPARLEVTRFTAAHKRLFDVIPPGGLELPVAAKARLLDAVSALAAEIRVQSVVAGGETVAAEFVEADPRPVVELVPAGAGLAVTVLVEPVPDSGTYFAPGHGGATVFVSRDGESLETRRDMSAERTAAEALVMDCPLLARSAHGNFAYQFSETEDCLELIDQLQSAGARCLWPRDEPYRIASRIDATQLSLKIKRAADWFSASGELQVDEANVVSLERLLALLDQCPRSRFLELERGQFLALSETFRRQLDELRALSKPGKAGAVRVHPLAALALDDLFDASEPSGDAAWNTLRARLRDAEAFEPELPSTLCAELRPYQHEGFLWLARLSRWGMGACLADDMGLGKTVQTLTLLLHRATDGPALVVAPTSVAANWVDEARRFAPTLQVLHYTGPPAERQPLLDALGPFDLVVVTYGLLQNDIERFANVTWHTAVLDEAQAIKNAATRRARAVRRLDAGFRLATTGTPIQNNLMDLHSLFAFLNPGFLGSAAQFRSRFLLPIERDGDADARARLRRLIAPFILRRTKSEVLDDLPSRTEITLNVELSEAEAALYEALRRRALDELEQTATDAPEGQRQVRVLAHLTRLRLACCHPKLVQDTWSQGSAKLGVFADTLRELLANRHKVLVFSQFVMHLKLIESFLADEGVTYQYLDGQTPVKARARRIAEFQAGKGDVFLISLKAGGTGLNLTAADYVIHMDPWWNPAVEDQASDRAHRIGQTRPVTIYRMVATGTIEEQIVELHHTKRNLADRLLTGADAPARLSAEELLDLIRAPLDD